MSQIHLVTTGDKIQYVEKSVLEYKDAFHFQFDGAGGCMLVVETDPDVEAREYEPITNYFFDGVQVTDYEQMLDLINIMFAPAGGGGGGGGTVALTTVGTNGAATLVGDVLNIPVYQGEIELTTIGTGEATLIDDVLNIPTPPPPVPGQEIELTTTGTTGAATLIGETLNIPVYQGDLTLTTLGGGAATLIGDILNIPTPPPSEDITLTTTGTSGLATLVGDVLNIPNYATVGKLGWYFPEDYGAAGDGITNDAAAFTAMIAAMPATGGHIHLSRKTYLINTTVTINKPVAMVGSYYSGTSFGSFESGSMIKTTGSNIVIFDVKEDYCRFSNFGMFNTNVTIAVGGAAFRMSGNARTGLYIYNFTIENMEITDFYDGILATNAFSFIISNCRFKGNYNYTVDVGCSSFGDAGDSQIQGCDFIGRTGGSIAAIHQTSSGGLKIINNKFNWKAGTTKFQFMIYTQMNSTTVDLIVTGNSFENYSQVGIYLNQITGTFANVVITGNQFASGAALYPDIAISHGASPQLRSVSIIGNVFRVGTVNLATAIQLQNCTNIILCNVYFSYTNPVTFTNCTDITDIRSRLISVEGNTSNSSLRVGTLEFQNYGPNNSWIGNNVYHNGSTGFISRATGAGAWIDYQLDEVHLRAAPSVSAGSLFVYKTPLKLSSNGTIALGGDISATNATYTGSTMLINANGVAIGTNGTVPQASSLLELSSTTKALLLMRMTKAQRDAIVTKVAGHTVYQTDNTPGIRVYNGTNWMRFTETID